MKKLFSMIAHSWSVFSKPSKHISLGIITCGAFLAGVIFWGGFNTALEATNTEAFCISCHSMKENNYQEIQSTIHWSNRSGVRATCPDCHVPHRWQNKIAAKARASKDVFGWLLGTVDTKEKFEDKRLHLAQNEWARFKANGSLECRNCHDYKSMDFTKMSEKAQVQMRGAAERDQSCLDCHKGIAHHLPEMDTTAISELGKMAKNLEGHSFEIGKEYYSLVQTPLYKDDKETEYLGVLTPATKFKVIAESGNRLEVELVTWHKAKGYGRVLYFDFAKNIVQATLSKEASQDESLFVRGDKREDDLTGLPWEQVTFTLWVDKKGYEENLQNIWDYAKGAYQTTCSVCHTQPAEAHFDANTWVGMFAGMQGFVNLDGDTHDVILKYLQNHSSDYSKAAH